MTAWLTSAAALACQSARPAHAMPAPDPATSGVQGFFGDDIQANETCAGPDPDAGSAPIDSADPLCSATVPPVSFQREVARLVGCTGEICHARWTYDTDPLQEIRRDIEIILTHHAASRQAAMVPWGQHLLREAAG